MAFGKTFKGTGNYNQDWRLHSTIWNGKKKEKKANLPE
jgi:hypothetical protein